MIKVKMLCRHHGTIGKMEQGLIYSLSPDYANELVKHGLAEFFIEPTIEMEKPIHIIAKEIGQMRTRSGRFLPRGKKDIKI